MALWYNVLSYRLRLTFHIGMSVQVPPLLLPAKAYREADDGLKTLALVTHVGDPHEVPNSWLHPGSELGVTAIWAVN